MTPKVGDRFTLDGTEIECTGSAPPDYFWFKEIDTHSYFYLFLKQSAELDDLFRAGRLKIGNADTIEGGKDSCAHWTWKDYVGIREVYSYCTNCGAKRHKDWRLIVDDKKY